MNILITGVAGFIGFNCAKSLLKKKKYKVYGIDNYDNYYSQKIKKKRVSKLSASKNFYFEKLDIKNIDKVVKYFKKKKINVVIHLAAQAGVRYSFINPSKYIDANIIGFINIILSSKKFKVKKIIYASSSSVYGNTKVFPSKENQILKPINIYGVSKKLNEQIANTYHSNKEINFIGLRFFTIYGEWGRPDMFLFKLFKSQILNHRFYLNNFGNHLRDFTYINDVNKIIQRLINKNFKKHTIFNICSNKPISILKIINSFKKEHNIKVKYIKKHKADMYKTHGSNNKIKQKLGIKTFANFEKAFTKTYNWYKLQKFYKY